MVGDYLKLSSSDREHETTMTLELPDQNDERNFKRVALSLVPEDEKQRYNVVAPIMQLTIADGRRET